MAIEITCEECNYDVETPYCEDCYNALKKIIEELEEDVYSLEKELEDERSKTDM